MQTHPAPSSKISLEKQVRDDDPPSLGFFTKTFTAVLSTTVGEEKVQHHSPLKPIQNLGPGLPVGSFPSLSTNNDPSKILPKTTDPQLEIHQRTARFSRVEQGQQMPPSSNIRTEVQNANAWRSSKIQNSDVAIVKKQDEISRPLTTPFAEQPAQFHHPVLAEILSSPPPRTRTDILTAPLINPSDSHQQLAASLNVKPASGFPNSQHRRQQPETEALPRPQPPQKQPELQGRIVREQPQEPPRTLNIQAPLPNSQPRLGPSFLSSGVPDSQPTVHKQDNLPRTEMSMSVAPSYQRGKPENYPSYKPLTQTLDKYGNLAQTPGPSRAPNGLPQIGRHQHSASLPTSFVAPSTANFPSREEVPRSANPMQAHFSMNPPGVINPPIHNSMTTLAATTSEETILMTPTSLAHSTKLKPTVSRQSVTPSVSSQTGRKPGGIFGMFRRTSAQAAAPPQYEIWHPTVQTPNSSPGHSNVVVPNPAPIAALPTPSTAPSAPQAPAPIAIPVRIHGATERITQNSNVYTPFRFLRSRKPHSISLASVEAQDGTAVSNPPMVYFISENDIPFHSQIPLLDLQRPPCTVRPLQYNHPQSGTIDVRQKNGETEGRLKPNFGRESNLEDNRRQVLSSMWMKKPRRICRNDHAACGLDTGNQSSNPNPKQNHRDSRKFMNYYEPRICLQHFIF